MKTYYCERYDALYETQTGKILEDISKYPDCPDTMFKDNWIIDGRPTHVPTEHQDHLIHAEMDRQDKIWEKIEMYDEIEFNLKTVK